MMIIYIVFITLLMVANMHISIKGSNEMNNKILLDNNIGKVYLKFSY
jgi:hypothetical protein